MATCKLQQKLNLSPDERLHPPKLVGRLKTVQDLSSAKRNDDLPSLSKEDFPFFYGSANKPIPGIDIPPSDFKGAEGIDPFRGEGG